MWLRFSERQWIVERGIVGRLRDAGQGVLSLHQQGLVVGILQLADQRLEQPQEGVKLFQGADGWVEAEVAGMGHVGLLDQARRRLGVVLKQSK